MSPAAEKIVILDRGNVELAVPSDWTVKPDPGGFMKIQDPVPDFLLEVSYLRLPPLSPDAPDAAGRVEAALPKPAPITSVDRGDLRLAWADYPYEADDPERRTRRVARGRILIAENGRFQVLATYYSWAEDGARAIPLWERIVATLRLGFGEQLRDPRDHWSMREPK
jgi:hypothetical protein